MKCQDLHKLLEDSNFWWLNQWTCSLISHDICVSYVYKCIIHSFNISLCSSDASVSGIGEPLGSSVKKKHLDDEEDEGMEAEEHEVKRLKFSQDGNDEEEDEDEVDQQVFERPRSTSTNSSSDNSKMQNHRHPCCRRGVRKRRKVNLMDQLEALRTKVSKKKSPFF